MILERLVAGAEHAVVALDADIATNPHVHQAAKRLGGAIFGVVRRHDGVSLLPASAKTGLDDWLAGVEDRPAVFANLLAMAGRLPAAPKLAVTDVSEVTAPTEPVDTFDDVPDEAGHRALDALVGFLSRYVAFAMPEQCDAVRCGRCTPTRWTPSTCRPPRSVEPREAMRQDQAPRAVATPGPTLAAHRQHERRLHVPEDRHRSSDVAGR